MQCISALKEMGHEVIEIELPNINDIIFTYSKIIVSAGYRDYEAMAKDEELGYTY